MSYEEQIKAIGIPTIDDFIRAAASMVPANFKDMPWHCPGMNHGQAILDKEEQLNCYMSSYGEMHKQKMTKILADFPFTEINDDFEVIDWGCGQGLGTICFIDYMRAHGLYGNLQRITLIEPSTVALKRAVFNVKAQTGNGKEVVSICKPLPANKYDTEAIDKIEVRCGIVVHLFSNILDIQSIDLKMLSSLIGDTGYVHYFLCVGPLNFGNERIDAFFHYFNLANGGKVFSEYRNGQYGILNNGHSFGCLTKGFKVIRDSGRPMLIPLNYYPPKQFFAAYELDCLRCDPLNNFKSIYGKLEAFDVLAPFDIGADVYEDVHPILAVLNNIITRGLPTRGSKWLEDAFQKQYGLSNYEEQYGGFRYAGTSKYIQLKDKEALIKIGVAVARLEKTIVEAAITNRIDINQPVWKVLVKENDVPCAAIAFDDLAIMFNHLTAMTDDYANLHFPKVELDIISKYDTVNWTTISKVRFFSGTKYELQRKEYDMVFDIAVDDYSDAAHVKFSEFAAKNDCYFNIRSAKSIESNRYVYTTDLICYKPMSLRNRQGIYKAIPENVEHLRYFLQMIFRKVDFRPGQLPILTQALQNKSVIGLLPTGGGKSLTYQLAALLEPGVSIVVDPLRSLMKDQYDGLKNNLIDCCTYINSSIKNDAPTYERDHREEMMETSQVLMMFLSPERLCIYKFRQRLKNMHNLNVYFAYGVIDEVHCVSEWGQDFRFSYLHLGRNLYSYVLPKKRHIALFGLTATASFDVLSDVERELSGYGAFPLDSNTVVRYENCNRLELQYKIEKVDIEFDPDRNYDPAHQLSDLPSAVTLTDKWTVNDNKKDFLRKLLPIIPGYIRELQTDDSIKEIKERFKTRESSVDVDKADLCTPMPDGFLDLANSYDEAGIVFCPHKKSTGISVVKNKESLSSLTQAIGTFMGSSDNDEQTDEESMRNLELFRDNKLPLMVATKAFGMGIDKPNVRFTVNMNYSSSLESYVQEAGRAGRDGKMALAIILLSYYDLVRINNSYPQNGFPFWIIKGKWFKADDLKQILNKFNIQIPDSYIDHCTPISDMVKLKCPTNNITYQQGHCNNQTCKRFDRCQLRTVSQNVRDWIYEKDLKDYLKQNRIRLSHEYFDFQNADYDAEMFFFDNNFKGELAEKTRMNDILSKVDIRYFYGDDKEIKEAQHAKGFMNVVLNAEVGQKIVILITYSSDEYADVAKAIYRLCCIGVIDDFTQHYGVPGKPESYYFRIVCERKSAGAYYLRLRDFLMRYYSEEKADNEVDKAALRKGNNEIHKCLGYLTEFVYDKVAIKRKRAIDDMQRFCLEGVRMDKDWKKVNEDLKDELYYYFNSKFARHGYQILSGESFSLLDEYSSLKENDLDNAYNILFKYLRVVDADVVSDSGSPIDSIRHLYGAIRLITHRSFREINPCMYMLNVYCLLFLRPWQNEALLKELKDNFRSGYYGFRKLDKQYVHFLDTIEKFYKEMVGKGRNAATKQQIGTLRSWQMALEAEYHAKWLHDFTDQY